jgi:HAMP domain-containing protein/signal transduction histidine kinase/ActR/RegA family two-component response regulator
MDPNEERGRAQHDPEHERSASRQRGGRHDGSAERLEDRMRALRDALRAARQGDFSVRLPTDGGDGGAFGEVALAFNSLIAENEELAGELHRVSLRAGIEGHLTERASLGPATGAWAAAMESVNTLIASMAVPNMEATRLLEQVAAGELRREMALHVDGKPLQGDFLLMGTTVNTVVSRLRSVSAGVSRVVRAIGTEGRLGGQAAVEGLGGTWKDLTEDVNLLSANLTAQLRNIALVSTAIANGDLSQKITVETRGEIFELKNTINTTVDQLRSFAAEVIRVAQEVGTDGRLGGQADVRGVSGVWQEVTGSVNRLAGNLTDQVRNIAQIASAIARGDLSQKITVEAKGEVLELKNTLNATVEQLRAFASEVTRVAREVGSEGRLGAQASVKGVSGTWKDLTDTVNMLAGNLTDQVRNVAAVATAIANGDLSKKITVEAQGEILELKSTINAMVDRLQTFAAEVTRVAREVGTQGRLGGQADVKGVSGTWKDLTDNVNLMASNLTNQVRGIAKVVTAVADGDLSQKFVVEAKGEIAELADTINDMTDTLRTFADQVVTVASEVGFEGKLGGQAKVPGVAGRWRDLTDNVNMLAGNLTNQVRNIALVTTAVANGDLSQKITVQAQGEIRELKNTINTMVDQLRTFASEVTRVAKEVGTEGKLAGQAAVPGVAGTWKDLTDNVNLLAANLTTQVRNIAAVTTAVANGDLSKKITVEARGEILELKDTINAMVDSLRTFASEVTRVAKEVGTDGKLGGQALVPAVAGTWKDLTDNVNVMALNLTSQVRGIAKVVTAVASGDLSQKFVVEAKGEIAELADTINSMTDSLRSFAEQVTSVAREVGIEGKLGGQARVPSLAGTWRDLTDNVNVLARNLTDQVRNIALVATAIANGDLSQKITVEAKGEILELKNTLNAMVDQLRTFAREVTRVAREVGTEGKLGGQAQVAGVAGTWQELTESVNVMASNLTSQVRGIAKVVTAVATGDLGQKLVLEARGEIAALADTINAMTQTLRTFADQVTTVAREVGIEGKLGGQARVPGAAGTWKDLTESTNMLAGNLTGQVRNIALVTTAVANGDLSKKITVEAKGEILQLKDTVNAMVEQLRTFAAEVTRVAREVGTDGKLGGQAVVPGMGGTWRDLTDNVNLMASNLTSQVRGIVQVVTAVATGDLTRRLVVAAKGEIAALADTINSMTDTLRTFADQVTTVAREVGIEGKLGGQAKVPGAFGTWRDLVDNVNQLAGNLTTQVRAISDVANAVTKGDLTRAIDVVAQGEVLSLKDTINQMIANLRDTTRTNKEQDWLKTNLAKFSSMMQGQRSLESLAQLIMSELTPVVSGQLGTFFVSEGEAEHPTLRLLSSYGYTRRKTVSNRFAVGEGLVGQAALEKKPIIVTQVPDDYVPVASSLGEAPPRSIVVLPIIFEGKVRGVLEFGSFEAFDSIHMTFLEQVALSIGVVFNMISASRRTEELLDELKRSNAELGRRSKELEEKAHQLEDRNREIALASASLEEKAKQLALVSKYKSEFLANMSHELRTPLNSVIILSNLLADNQEKNLTHDQLEYSRTILSSGRDLLGLINQILDLSKIEAGRMEIERKRVPIGELAAYAEQHFRPLADQKGLGFTIAIAPEAPASITTDPQRIQQILKNLLSNAFKFTETGSVELRVGLEVDTERFSSQTLRRAPRVVSISVVDTGIGIAPEKQQIIFEAFQQADPSTSRLYGGTGLGLTISRELARLIGGEIHLRSTAGAGSKFTLYLPMTAADQSQLAPMMEVRGGYEAASTQPEAPERPALQAAPEETAAAPAAEKELGGKKVLVVDDDVRNLFAVTSLLERRGAKVLPAGSAKEAFSLLENNRDVALVLLDMMMPEIDGYDAARHLRADERSRALPIIALTAKAMSGDRDKALAAGCNDFVPKPVEQDRLVAVLRHWVHEEAA